MTTAVQHPPKHRVFRWVEGAHAELDELVDAPLWSMDAAETAETLVELDRLRSRVAELELRIAGHAEEVEVPASTGATSVAHWLAHATRQTRRDTHREMRLAAALGVRDRLWAGVASGEVSLEQARVIANALDELPDDLDPDLLDRAEATLVAYAAEHDPRALKILGRRVLDVVAPEVADAHEAELLERGARGRRGVPVDDDRRRAREDLRPVHPVHRSGRGPEEGTVGDRRPEAPGRQRRAEAGGAAALPGAAR